MPSLEDLLSLSPGDNTPVVRLRDDLIDAKRGHEPFDTAWAPARDRAVHGLSVAERNRWLRVFEETQHEWRACYQGTHSSIPRLIALQRLAAAA